MQYPNRRSILGLGALALAGCSGPSALNALVPHDTYAAQQDLPYGPGPRQMADLYRPLSPASDAPLVVFFYGGNWTRGARADYRFVGESLASAGIVTVVADYRLSPQADWTAILQDCAAATGWAFERASAFGASPRRVHLMGHSAGAYNAAMLALDPRWLQPHGLRPDQLAGWIGVAGPYDFLPIGDPEVQRTFHWPDTPRASQPIAHVTPRAPRTLLVAARDDDVVDPQRNTGNLAAALQRAGVPVRLALEDHVSHVTVIAALASPLRALAPVRSEVTGFVLGA